MALIFMKRQSIFNKILGIILSIMIMAEPMVAFSAPKKDKPAASKTSSKKSSAAKKSSTKTKNKSKSKANSSKSTAKKKSTGTSTKANNSKNSKKSTGNKNVKNQKNKTKVVNKKVCKKVKGKQKCSVQKVTVPIETNTKTKIVEKKVCKTVKVKGKKKKQCTVQKVKVQVPTSNKQQQPTKVDDADQTTIQSKEIVESAKERESSRDTENKQRSDDLLMSAMSLLGVSYRFGGSSPTSGMDCSGFIQYIFRQALNVNLPRTSAEMATVGKPVDKSDLQVGDLVFFARNGKRIGHVGMYIGEGKFIHAPRTGKDIEIQSLNKPYYVKTYAGARRVSSSTRKSKITE